MPFARDLSLIRDHATTELYCRQSRGALADDRSRLVQHVAAALAS